MTKYSGLLCAAFLLPSLKTEAVVIYTDIPDTGVFGFTQDAFLDIDLNHDNTVDFRLRSSFGSASFSVLPQSGNSIFSTPISPPDLNTFAIDFDRDAEIGPQILGDNLVLIGQRFSSGREIGAGLLGCVAIGQGVSCLGQFNLNEDGSSDFIGVALEVEGQTHYGYIEVLSSGFNGGTIRSFAFESEPDTPIFAGAIPEPSSSLLLGAFSVAALLRRRRISSLKRPTSFAPQAIEYG